MGANSNLLRLHVNRERDEQSCPFQDSSQGMDLIQSRFENILQMKLDNADAFSATRSAVFKGALFDEVFFLVKEKIRSVVLFRMVQTFA